MASLTGIHLPSGRADRPGHDPLLVCQPGSPIFQWSQTLRAGQRLCSLSGLRTDLVQLQFLLARAALGAGGLVLGLLGSSGGLVSLILQFSSSPSRQGSRGRRARGGIGYSPGMRTLVTTSYHRGCAPNWSSSGALAR
ncbi:hypothetical protein ACQP1G_21515 [Nocardia sp. CA-107356]|uniref:hypothetical protein n=1 Tax=Nocardia sp. CA-107356 TaxID=3239972 RepID=UPI003D8E302C